MSVQSYLNTDLGSNHTIMQWNINGVNDIRKKDELKIIYNNFHPVVICLQETHLAPIQDFVFLPTFSIYRQDFTEGLIACGGVMTMVSKHHYSEVISVTSPLQVIAVKVKITWLSYEITICNIYVPPSFRLKEKDLSDLISQVPSPCILCGDLNAHSPIWNAPKCNSNGLEVQNFLEKNVNMFLLNDDQPTHLNSSYGTLSTIDLSFISSSIVSDVVFRVHDDTCSSDHFPLFINFYKNSHINYRDTIVWLYKNADWVKFKHEINFHENFELSNNINDIMGHINKNILEAANSAIPKLNLSKIKRMVPWWCEEIKIALRERKNAIRTYKRDRTQENFIEYKRRKAKARFLIKQNKKASWMLFVDSIKDPISQSDMWTQVAKFKGKKKLFNPISALKNENDVITSCKEEIVDILVKNYSKNSSDSLYDTEFRTLKSNLESKIAPPENTERCVYNLPFTMAELTSTFKSCRSSAVGIDNISYQMIIQLPQGALDKLLEVFNFIWLN